MDYQCVVVYTIIDIPAFTDDTNQNNECAKWFKDKFKRFTKTRHLQLESCRKHSSKLGNLASLHYKEGQLDLAINTYKKAIELKPDFPDAYCNLANALKEKGLLPEAEECYNKALLLCSSHVDSLNNLANLKRELGNFDEATKLYMKALNILPNFAVAHNNLASLFHQQGKLQAALRHYEKAIHIKPKFADAYSNMGNTLRELRDIINAVVCFEKAIEINPSFADAHCNMASIHKEINNISKAIEFYKNALEIKPNFPDAFCNLIHCYSIICEWENYEENLRFIVALVEKQLNDEKICSVHPHHSILYPFDNTIRKKIASRHAFLYASKAAKSKNHYQSRERCKNKIRIGYVSSDFGDHPTSHLMQSLPSLHNRNKVEVYCYALNPNDESDFRKKIMQGSDKFIDLSVINCNLDAANMINKDNIQILVNMNGYTKGARNEIFALRPAPIEIMWLGYPGTSGAEFMDYIITDSVSSPLEENIYYSEKFAYMPRTYFIGDHKQMFPHLKKRYKVKSACTLIDDSISIINCAEHIKIENKLEISIYSETVKYLGLDDINTLVTEIIVSPKIINSLKNNQTVQIPINDTWVVNGLSMKKYNYKVASGEHYFDGIVFTTRSHYGIPDDAVVYCNFNQLYKLTPDTLLMWINILLNVPKSILWLLCFPPAGKPNVIRYATKMGLPPDRIIFSKVACKEEHVRRGQLADICLDTPICNGHTTSMDILWTGTPLVTLPGETLASRVAASQLTTLGCPELIAKDKNQYEEIAVKLGIDKEYRKYMRAKVAKARLESPLFDCQQYVENLESLYEKMWKRYEDGAELDHIV